MGSLYHRITKSCLASSLALGMLAATVQAQPKPIEESSRYIVDLSRSHWCYDCIVDVVDRYQVMAGFNDQTFRGDWAVTRYDMAVALRKTLDRMLVRYQVDIPEEMGPVYTLGMDSEHWAYSDAHVLLRDYNLMSMLMERAGLRGDKMLTRAELAYVLSELLMRAEVGANQRIVSNRRMSTRAIDLNPESVFLPYIQAALDRFALMSLSDDHRFKPEDVVTRYELAAALCRLFELVEAQFS